MKELRDAHAHRRHQETASSRATSSSTGGTSRSDIVTGTLNPAFAPLSTLAPPERLTSPELSQHQKVFSLDDEQEEPAVNTSSQMNQEVSAINNLSAILQREVTQTRVLHTQVPNFRGSEDKFNKLKHLLFNHLRPHFYRIREENKLQYFQSLLRDQSVDF